MAQDLPPDSQAGTATEAPNGWSLDRAVRRLEQALFTLEAKLAAKAERLLDENGDLFAQRTTHDEDRSRLAAELGAARAREKALEEVAAEASAALGRAAAEVRAALAAGES